MVYILNYVDVVGEIYSKDEVVILCDKSCDGVNREYESLKEKNFIYV